MTAPKPDTPSTSSTPYRPCCAACGSGHVLRDAWATWDADRGRWILEVVFDHAYCSRCEATTRLVWHAPRPEAVRA